MLVIKPEDSVAVTNVQPSAMTADASKMAKLYFMISSTLYTDKFMSIIRELCSNARDSHAEAGKLDTPFTIIAPTLLDPRLIIGDVGTGIDYPKAKKTILMFLGSTKDEDDEERGFMADDAIGGWGIGAKSPRAYTSTYQVIMRLDGIETAVQVFDQKGMPQEVAMYTEKTSKPNGLEFIVPIKPADVPEWRRKVVEYMKFTNYSVEAFMGDGEVIRPEKPFGTVKYDDFTVEIYGTPDRYSKGHSEKPPILLYGGMRYEIPSSFNLKGQLDEIAKLLSFGLEIRINVTKPNAVKFGLSREHLELETQTLNLVTYAVKILHDDMKKAVNKEWEQSFSTRTFRRYSEVLKYSAEVQAAVEAGKASLYGRYCRAFSTSALWSPMQGMYRSAWSRGIYRKLTNHSPTFVLPLDSYHITPEVIVMYSDKTPTNNDWASTLANYSGSYGIRFPGKTLDSEVVTKWFNSLSEFEGTDLRLVYVESSCSKNRAGRGSGSNAGSVFATCAETGERVKIVPDMNFIMVPSLRHKALYSLMKQGTKNHYFVPTKAFEKRIDEMPGNVYEHEDFLEDEEVQTWIRRSFSGMEITKEQAQMLRAASNVLPNSSRKLPPELIEELENVRSKIMGYANYANQALLHQALYGQFKDLVTEQPVYDFTPGLKRLNAVVYTLNRYENTFALFDFPLLKTQVAAGNPEAKRLVMMMQLEQFL